ncbi:MAG: TonB family protein [Marinifilaceae bacterium]
MRLLFITAIFIAFLSQTAILATAQNPDKKAQKRELKEKKREIEKLNYLDIEVKYSQPARRCANMQYIMNNKDGINNKPYEFTKGNVHRFVNENIERLPKEIFERKLQGKVHVQFMIDENGEVQDIRVVQRAHPYLDKFTVYQIMKTSGYWKPAIKDGKPVSAMYDFPIKYSYR